MSNENTNLEVTHKSSRTSHKIQMSSKQHKSRRSRKEENGRGISIDIKKKKRRRSQERKHSRNERGSNKLRKAKTREEGNKSKETASEVQGDSSVQILELLERLHNPTVAKLVEVSRINPSTSVENDLTKIPWCIQLISENEKDAEKPLVADGSESKQVAKENDIPTSSFPKFSFMDLRTKQNMNWATRRLRDGVKLAKESKWRQAEACYKEGLNLVPDHAELQVAYGALYANTGRKREAISILEKVIKNSPGVANAQQYLDAIRNPNGAAPKAPPVRTTAAETALRDAMAERAFLDESPNKNVPEESKADTGKDNQSLPVEDARSHSSRDSYSSSERQRQHTRHKHHRRSYERGRSRKRTHRRRHRSPSFSDSTSVDSRNRSRRRRHRSPSFASSPRSAEQPRTDRMRSPVVASLPIDSAPPETNGEGPSREKVEENEASTPTKVGSRSPSASSSYHRSRRRRRHRSPSHSDSDCSSSRRRRSSRHRRRHHKHGKKKSHKKHKKSSRRHKRRRRRSPSTSDASSRSRNRHDSPVDKQPIVATKETPDAGIGKPSNV